ncbi:MAG TPA: DUF4173 domain-containing protein, partial [Acidimicrobiales bacterium]|nr:DUF4173 domain-containing protein [Acidimicrobiales bacterium]
RTVLLALAAGVAFDVGARQGWPTVGGALTFVVAAAAILASGRMRTTASRVCLGAAALFGSMLALRSSEWLLVTNVLAALGALALAGVLARSYSIGDLPARVFASRAMTSVAHGIASAAFLAAPVRRVFAGRRASVHGSAGLRGIALAAPIVLVLGALLASADAVFASLFDVRVPMPDDVIGHALLVVIGACGVGGVIRTASARSLSADDVPAPTTRLGVTEWTIVLGSVVALFAVFAASQAVTHAGGARHVLETEGLTYAEHARRGYFQLLAAAAFAGMVLAALRTYGSMPDARATRRFTVLAQAMLVLTGVVLVVSVRRLGLYEDAYGWTMLRLYVKASAVWMGAVLLLTAVRFAGVLRQRDWLPSAALAAGALVVLALNVLNPADVVARHNLRMTRALDVAYLVELSDDAVPAVVDTLPSLPPDVRAELVARVCATTTSEDNGVLGWNASVARAEQARAALCVSPSTAP